MISRSAVVCVLLVAVSMPATYAVDLSGRVSRAGSGAGAAEVKVYLQMGPADTNRAPDRTVTTGRLGGFVFSDVPSNTDYELWVKSDEPGVSYRVPWSDGLCHPGNMRKGRTGPGSVVNIDFVLVPDDKATASQTASLDRQALIELIRQLSAQLADLRSENEALRKPR